MMSLYEKKPWMDQEPPPGYIPGIGRGATGFTTRSDIGPARDAMDMLIPERGAPRHKTQQQQMKQQPQGGPPGADDDGDRGDYSDAVFDPFYGFKGGFSDPNAVYDKEDEEADEFWAKIEERMDSRRKDRREAMQKQEEEEIRNVKPKIQQQFADLKEQLATVSTNEWDQIPEIGDHTMKYKKKKNTGFVPVPDSVIMGSKMQNEISSILDSSLEAPLSGTTDLTQLGEARTTALNLNLERISDSISGQTVVDPKSFMSGMDSMKLSSSADIGDINKLRLLLKSLTSTNPNNGPAWIAAARLEEIAGKLAVARKLITQGCQQCPSSEDVWIEAARLHPPDTAKSILARAIEELPKSIKIWLYAANMETETKAKKRVLRKALEFNPSSVKLWKAAVELEEPEDAKIMLGRAVECVPHSVEMWLALAHLENYENARKVLNNARKAIPTEPQIWITAAKLEEGQNNMKMVDTIVKKAIKSLANQSISREQWLKEAESCETAKAPVTCQCIVNETIGIGVEEEDRKRIWSEEAEGCLKRGFVQTARAIYAHALEKFPAKKSIWLRSVQLEKSHGNSATLREVLSNAVKNCPKAEILWLMAAKEAWTQGNVDDARGLLTEAFAANPNSEQIWLAAVKLEQENDLTERARVLLTKAREKCDSERVWLKSAILERQVGDIEQEAALLDTALSKFPQYPKFWMMRGQLEEGRNNLQKAQELYQRALKNCPKVIPLWLIASSLEEKISPAKARSLLEKARQLNHGVPELWLEAVRIERRASNVKVAQTVLAKALQECPNSGLLWAEAVEIESNAGKKTKSVEALKRCDHDPNVLVAVVKIFWADRKVEKARSWFNRAVSLDPDLGDTWAYFYKFELQHGKDETQKAVLQRCVAAEPHHGEKWCKIAKDPANYKLKIDQILKKVVETLETIH